MVRVIKGLLAFGILLAFLVFCFENFDAMRQNIPLEYNLYYYKVGPGNFPVWVIFLLALASGILITFLLEVGEYVKYRTEVRTLRRKTKRLERELKSSRSSVPESIEEPDTSAATDEDEE